MQSYTPLSILKAPSNLKIVIAGGAGYIGRHLYTQLIQEGYDVYIWDSQPFGKINSVFPQTIYFEIDLSDPSNFLAVEKRASELGKEVVLINLAALKSVTESVLDPDLYMRNNFGITKNLVKVATDLGWLGYIFASSAAVYGSSSEEAHEGTEPIPESPYGRIKLLEEEYLTNLLTEAKLNFCIFRFFNVVGAESSLLAESSGINLFPAISNSIRTGIPLTIYGHEFETKDGTAIRDYVDVRDIADAFSIAVNRVSTECLGILNLGTGKGYTVNEVISAFSRRFNFTVEYSPPRPGDLAKLIAISKKANSLLGWEPKRSIEDSIQGLYN